MPLIPDCLKTSRQTKRVSATPDVIIIKEIKASTPKPKSIKAFFSPINQKPKIKKSKIEPNLLKAIESVVNSLEDTPEKTPIAQNEKKRKIPQSLPKEVKKKAKFSPDKYLENVRLSLEALESNTKFQNYVAKLRKAYKALKSQFSELTDDSIGKRLLKLEKELSEASDDDLTYSKAIAEFIQGVSLSLEGLETSISDKRVIEKLSLLSRMQSYSQVIGKRSRAVDELLLEAVERGSKQEFKCLKRWEVLNSALIGKDKSKQLKKLDNHLMGVWKVLKLLLERETVKSEGERVRGIELKLETAEKRVLRYLQASELKRQKELEKQRREEEKRQKKEESVAMKTPEQPKVTLNKFFTSSMKRQRGKKLVFDSVEKKRFSLKTMLGGSSVEADLLGEIKIQSEKAKREDREKRQKRFSVSGSIDALALARLSNKKLLQFSEDYRPPYHGTVNNLEGLKLKGAETNGFPMLRRLSRNPLLKLENNLNQLLSPDYDYDSGLEWEEPEDGESIVSEKEVCEGIDELDYNDGWLAKDDTPEDKSIESNVKIYGVSYDFTQPQAAQYNVEWFQEQRSISATEPISFVLSTLQLKDRRALMKLGC